MLITGQKDKHHEEKNQKFNWTHNIGLEVNAEKIMSHISSECKPKL
jgi:hypothetical protein